VHSLDQPPVIVADDEPDTAEAPIDQGADERRPGAALVVARRELQAEDTAFTAHGHTLVAVDERGRKLAERTHLATPAGHLALLRWATKHFVDRHWALEDFRHLSRGFERDLLAAGETVVRVPPSSWPGNVGAIASRARATPSTRSPRPAGTCACSSTTARTRARGHPHRAAPALAPPRAHAR